MYNKDSHLQTFQLIYTYHKLYIPLSPTLILQPNRQPGKHSPPQQCQAPNPPIDAQPCPSSLKRRHTRPRRRRAHSTTSAHSPSPKGPSNETSKRTRCRKRHRRPSDPQPVWAQRDHSTGNSNSALTLL